MKQILYIIGITILFSGIHKLHNMVSTEMNDIPNENTINDTIPTVGPHDKDLIIFIDSLGGFNLEWSMGGQCDTIPGTLLRN
tara:strand:- start:2810 stop:3055 length:246 start_codon:yes stop_codon:yes gene_type:complete